MLDGYGEDKTMSFICDLLCKVIDELGSDNIFSVVMDGTCKEAFPLIRTKYPHMKCFTCVTQVGQLLMGSKKHMCHQRRNSNTTQRNAMGGWCVMKFSFDGGFFEASWGSWNGRSGCSSLTCGVGWRFLWESICAFVMDKKFVGGRWTRGSRWTSGPWWRIFFFWTPHDVWETSVSSNSVLALCLS